MALCSVVSLSTLRPRGHQRGFTLLEVMTVVIIIGVLVALAMPSFEDRIRDRRANQAAQEAAYVYRVARSRALGRGAAQLVRFHSDVRTYGQFDSFEATQLADGTTTVGSCGTVPVSSCYVNWQDVGTARPTGVFPTDLTLYASVGFQFKVNAADTTGAAYTEICFPPSGRALYRNAIGGAWTVLASIPEIAVQRYDSTNAPVGLLRRVLLTPNGAARLAL